MKELYNRRYQFHSITLFLLCQQKNNRHKRPLTTVISNLFFFPIKKMCKND